MLTELRARLGVKRKSSSRVRRILAGLPQAMEATAAWQARREGYQSLPSRWMPRRVGPDGDFLGAAAEGEGDGVADVIGPLRGAPDGDLVVVVGRGGALGLAVIVLDGAARVDLLVHRGGDGEGEVGIARRRRRAWRPPGRRRSSPNSMKGSSSSQTTLVGARRAPRGGWGRGPRSGRPARLRRRPSPGRGWAPRRRRRRCALRPGYVRGEDGAVARGELREADRADRAPRGGRADRCDVEHALGLEVADRGQGGSRGLAAPWGSAYALPSRRSRGRASR